MTELVKLGSVLLACLLLASCRATSDPISFQEPGSGNDKGLIDIPLGIPELTVSHFFTPSLLFID